jgi:hypothetical protein
LTAGIGGLPRAESYSAGQKKAAVTTRNFIAPLFLWPV